jgi:hypothetical protein
LLQELDEIRKDLLDKWSEIKKALFNYKHIKRVNGVIYEVLFYLNAIYTISIFKGS